MFYIGLIILVSIIILLVISISQHFTSNLRERESIEDVELSPIQEQIIGTKKEDVEKEVHVVLYRGIAIKMNDLQFHQWNNANRQLRNKIFSHIQKHKSWPM
jgi:hypothetical protein